MRIAIVVLCTNAYFVLGIRFVKNFMKHYRGDKEIVFYLYTDTDPHPYTPNITNVVYKHTVHTCWVDGTNSKFKSIVDLAEDSVDYIYYFDADTNVDSDFTEDWFLGDLVGGEHYNNRWGDEKPYERCPTSAAYIPRDTDLPQTYYYGAFFGGSKERVIPFCKSLIERQEKDRAVGFEPCWNDESYINCYFHYFPPTFVVPNDKFPFNISDKGGIGETRDTDLDIEEYKQAILENADSCFEFVDKQVVTKRI